MKLRNDYSQYLGKHVKIRSACGSNEEKDIEGDIIQIIHDPDSGEDVAVVYEATYKTRQIAVKGARISVLGTARIFDSCSGSGDWDSAEDRITKITDRLKEVWQKAPDLRLGQLLCELLRLSQSDGYYLSDRKLYMYLDELEKLLLNVK